MRIDSHQHFWIYDSQAYPWITEKLAELKRDFLPKELELHLRASGLNGSVAVQARQSLAESSWLLSLAEHSSIIKGVVGWVDLRSPWVAQQLSDLAQKPKFVGVRHVIQDEPDENFLIRPEFIRGLRELKQFNLSYDLLVYPKQLPAAIELARQMPEQRFVLDHLAKPFVRDRVLSPWKEQIRDLAKSPNIWCKVSGLVTEAKWRDWKKENFAPYLDVVFESFGTDRLMYGSDWPVCLISAEYEQVYGLLADYIAQFPQSARDKILGQNAVDFYKLKA